MQNILITGGDGQLGTAFKLLKDFDINYNFIFTNSKELDITNQIMVEDFLYVKKVNTIINCAAYTSVEKAEIEQKKANKINHLAVANLAKVVKKNGIKLIHISTDYVFDGLNNNPYIETDPTNPQNVYGNTKLKGEIAIKRINPKNSIIIRTSWLYFKFGNNFPNKILEFAKKNKKISVLSDEIGTPTYAIDLAKTIIKILPKINNDNVELFHFSNKGICSRYDFAKEIFKINGINIHLVPVSCKDFESKVNRPKFSALSVSKIENKYKLTIPSWVDSLENNFLNNL